MTLSRWHEIFVYRVTNLFEDLWKADRNMPMTLLWFKIDFCWVATRCDVNAIKRMFLIYPNRLTSHLCGIVSLRKNDSYHVPYLVWYIRFHNSSIHGWYFCWGYKSVMCRCEIWPELEVRNDTINLKCTMYALLCLFGPYRWNIMLNRRYILFHHNPVIKDRIKTIETSEIVFYCLKRERENAITKVSSRLTWIQKLFSLCLCSWKPLCFFQATVNPTRKRVDWQIGCELAWKQHV